MKAELKKRYAKKYIRDVVITIILGILILIPQVQNLVIQQMPIIEIEQLEAEELKNNQKVKMSITQVLACYKQIESKEAEIVSRAYVVPVNDYYIGVEGYYDETISIDANLNTTIDYMNDKQAGIEQIEAVEVEGTIRKMDSLSEDYYTDCVSELTMDEGEKEQYLRYVLHINEIGSAPIEITEIFIVIAILIMLSGAIMLYQGSSKRYMRHIIKHCTRASNPEKEKYEIEKLFTGPMEGEYLRVGNERVILYTENEAKVYNVSNVIWIYEHPLPSLTMTVVIPFWLSWIPIFKTKYLVFATEEGKRIKIKMKNDQMIYSIMTGLKRNFPHMYFDYSNKLDNMYIKNRQKMIDSINRYKQNQEQNKWKQLYNS